MIHSNIERTHKIGQGQSWSGSIAEIDKLEKDILRSHRKLICDTVQSEDIVTRLVQRGVLSHEDKNRVCLSRKNGERMALLLDIVEKKAGKSFTVFCDVLKFGYKSIHDQMVAARHAPLLLLQQGKFKIKVKVNDVQNDGGVRVWRFD